MTVIWTSLIRRLTEVLKPLGPTNYQFRRHEGEYLVIEVNPRISSATSIRAAFGYNEATMCVDWFVNGHRPQRPNLKKGRALSIPCRRSYLRARIVNVFYGERFQ